jgi:hypothetical protein
MDGLGNRLGVTDLSGQIAFIVYVAFAPIFDYASASHGRLPGGAGILERKGVFEGEGPLSPPETMLGRGFGVRFRSPLDRLRRASELIGVQQTFEFAGQIAQFDPTVLDRLDADRALDLAQEINGAPRAIFKRDEEVEQLRAEREQLAPAQAALAAAAEMAGGESADQLTETGIEGLENANALLEQLGLGAAPGAEAGQPLGPDLEPGLPQPV